MKTVLPLIASVMVFSICQAQDGKIVQITTDFGRIGGTAIYFGVYDGWAYFEIQNSGRAIPMECEKIRSIVLGDGSEVPFDCLENTLDSLHIERLTVLLEGYSPPERSSTPGPAVGVVIPFIEPPFSRVPSHEESMASIAKSLNTLVIFQLASITATILFLILATSAAP